MKNNYPKEEKLKSKNHIALLFRKGKWVSYGNLRLIYISLDPTNDYASLKIDFPEVQKVGVSVSKKFYKKAVDRNRIKRLLRETYRLNKQAFLNQYKKHTLCMLFYTSKNKPKNFSEIEADFLGLCKINPKH